MIFFHKLIALSDMLKWDKYLCIMLRALLFFSLRLALDSSDQSKHYVNCILCKEGMTQTKLYSVHSSLFKNASNDTFYPENHRVNEPANSRVAALKLIQ